MDSSVQSASRTARFEEGGSAHWFKPERFLEPNFNAEQYVADARRYVSSLLLWGSSSAYPQAGCAELFPYCMMPIDLQVPLDTLAAELQGHLDTLRNRLVEVINEDYADFVSLSSKLVNVDSSVARMQRPLLDIQVSAMPGTQWPLSALKLPLCTGIIHHAGPRSSQC